MSRISQNKNLFTSQEIVGKRTLLTELINLINEIQFKLKNNHSFDWTPTPEINLAQVDPPVQLQTLFCLMTHHWSIKQNNFIELREHTSESEVRTRDRRERSRHAFPMDKKSQKIHRPGTGGYNWSVSDHPEGFQTYFSHLEGLSGTFPPISTSGKNHTKMITAIFRSDLYRFAKAIKSTDNRDSRLRNHQVIKKFFFQSFEVNLVRSTLHRTKKSNTAILFV